MRYILRNKETHQYLIGPDPYWMNRVGGFRWTPDRDKATPFSAMESAMILRMLAFFDRIDVVPEYLDSGPPSS